MSAEATTSTPHLKLTEEMRLATKSAHSFSQSAVNAKLLVSFTNKKVYGQAVLLFYYIYAQIELSMRSQKKNPLFKDVLAACEKLHRSDAFVKDVDYYLEAGWNKQYGPPPAVVAYVNRIKELEKEDPILVIPYAYHMYITLLSGGPYIKKMVARAFSLPDANGVQIFEFDSPSLMALRAPLKDAVDALPMDAETKKRFLAESLRVFQSNNEVVKGIEGMGRQFALWLLKWIIVIQLIYWTYVLFVQGKPAVA